MIPPNYDSMIAKLITHGNNRLHAVNLMSQALSQTRLIGVTTNLNLLADIVNQVPFKQAELSTNYLIKYSPINNNTIRK